MLAIKSGLKQSSIFFITFMSIFVCFFFFKTGVSESPDDISYLTALSHSGLFDYFMHRYNTWSGRVVVEFLAVSIMPHPYALKLFMVACYIILSYSIWRITLADKICYQYGMPLVTTLTLMITPSVSAEAVYWAAGAFNYLVPVSLGMFSICVLLNQNAFNTKIKIISLIALIVSSNSEQCAILLLFISFLNLVFSSENRVNQYSSLHYIINITFSLLLFISPGAHQRFIIESEKFMPNFDDFSFFQKISFGIDRHVSGVFDKGEILFVVSSVMLIFFTIRKSGFFYQLLRFSFAVFISCKYIILGDVTPKFLSPDNWLSFSKYLYYGIVTSLSSLMLICTLDSELGITTKRNCAFSLVMGAAITVAIGLSPTVYASGERILYFSEIFLIIFICSLIRDVKKPGMHDSCQ